MSRTSGALAALKAAPGGTRQPLHLTTGAAQQPGVP
jgi:hypothetical protein